MVGRTGDMGSRVLTLDVLVLFFAPGLIHAIIGRYYVACRRYRGANMHCKVPILYI